MSLECAIARAESAADCITNIIVFVEALESILQAPMSLKNKRTWDKWQREVNNLKKTATEKLLQLKNSGKHM